MRSIDYLKENLFNIKSPKDFEDYTIEVFRYQYKHNAVYKNYIDLINCKAEQIMQIDKIPFLPIEFFKNHKVICGNKEEELLFLSSGTTGMIRSKHYVVDSQIYITSFIKSFELIYGNPENYIILALLPNYLERGGSSLVFMVDELIKRSNNANSGFYLYEHKELLNRVKNLQKSTKKVLLIGVSYALLDLTVDDSSIFKDVIILETGGMKGKRKETTKSELHQILRKKFQTENIHSEYGMTELLSQAYSIGNGLFDSPPWMKILIRDTYDPFSYLPNGKSGGINIIDLANINSCSFIETKDIGKLRPNNQFEVLGRFDNSDIRGCNLMIN